MKKRSMLSQKTTAQKGLGVLLAGVMAVVIYQATPGSGNSATSINPVVRMTRQPRAIMKAEVSSNSSAAQEKHSLQASISSLSQLKNRSPQQERQLRVLRARHDMLARMEDYELRIALHQEDSNYDTRSLHLQLENLKVEYQNLVDSHQ